MLQKNDEEVIGSYDKVKAVVRRRIETVAESGSTSFARMVMCIS